ncbi:DNA-deoxyinosine glycosylase [Curvibacter sp. PAE-UM]|uniref:DNA-deoxyinosine glycosylase n=1 Tax=Curvibacter sp. PAE-UM TaxID=1714344 RepID=UPI000710B81D|nr:DNA-deoxyinosine glycosylase [Curvibacter sp. PAE-UM]KRH99702.1 DNA-deoxyinosine glycosylase [Curvibacter sp. PAE-UM]
MSRQSKPPAGRLQGLLPIVGPGTRVLILGSFPSVMSLQLQQYYAHPQNHFWKILQALWPQHALPGREQYPQRCAWVLARGLGIWDVYASCEREGSLDSAIRNAEVNDFAGLKAKCPQLKLIVHNGGESFRHAKLVRASLGVELFPLVKLPSTSPANASWSFERKLLAWREAVVQAGLL